MGATRKKGEKGEASADRGVVVVTGRDRVGIVAGLSEVLAQAKVNILDIQQTLFGELFVMSMLVDLEGRHMSLSALRERLGERGRELGVQVVLQHESVFRYMHRI